MHNCVYIGDIELAVVVDVHCYVLGIQQDGFDDCIDIGNSDLAVVVQVASELHMILDFCHMKQRSVIKHVENEALDIILTPFNHRGHVNSIIVVNLQLIAILISHFVKHIVTLIYKALHITLLTLYIQFQYHCVLVERNIHPFRFV